MSRVKLLTAVVALAAGLVVSLPVNAAEFYPLETVGVTLPQSRSWSSIFNLIQGPGVGYDYSPPHDKVLEGDLGDWLTDTCGGGCDYIEAWGQPVIALDLGQDRELIEVSVWGHSQIGNSVSEFGLRFATAVEGPAGYGTSITYNPTFKTDGEDITRESFPLSQSVNARYVEFTVIDNFYEDGGDQGDQVGLGEIAFQAAPGVVIPKPDPVQFFPIESIESSTLDSDLFPAENLIQGPGVGFSDIQPHQKTSSGAEGLWVTTACGFPCDYLESFDSPVLWLDLGEDQELNEIDLWGYSNSNANGVQEFSLRFATEADGSNGYGKSIDYNPTFSDIPNDDLNRKRFPFDDTVKARYVEFTALDNFFVAPGDGSGGTTPGGDRVGLGELAFPIIERISVPGDFDGDGQLTATDIDTLSTAVRTGLTESKYDLNSDGAVNDSDREVWVNDLRHTYFGDANLDGEFNSSDFVDVFVQGEYEDTVAGNSGWASGDWNGDANFDSGDFVAAFVAGGYELGPRGGAVAAVPEPTGFVLLTGGVLLGLLSRRRTATLRRR